jgi:outer membrane protein assembly factor BamD
MKSIVPILLIAAGLFAFTGCAWFGDKSIEKPAQELVQDGMEAYEKGQFREAIKNFEQLKDWFPYNKYAILAELKIADAHYYLNEYEEAILAYEEFEQLHPRNEAIPYVIYQTGRCYYDRMDSVDRDQTSAQKALETFKRLVQQHPDDPFAKQVQTHILKCCNSLAGHELYVGRYYLKMKNYEAALQRFKGIIDKYPDTGVHIRALRYITECQDQMAQMKAAEQAEQAGQPVSTGL